MIKNFNNNNFNENKKAEVNDMKKNNEKMFNANGNEYKVDTDFIKTLTEGMNNLEIARMMHTPIVNALIQFYKVNKFDTSFLTDEFMNFAVSDYIDREIIEMVDDRYEAYRKFRVMSDSYLLVMASDVKGVRKILGSLPKKFNQTVFSRALAFIKLVIIGDGADYEDIVLSVFESLNERPTESAKLLNKYIRVAAMLGSSVNTH